MNGMPRTYSIFLAMLFPCFLQAQPVAFPGAEGFGALATGGRGGTTVHVINLNDSGPGSFRDAVSAEKRVVIFDVGGVIHIKSPLSIASDITLAGQSAPGDGVAIYGSAVSLSDASNIIVRYMRFREGISGPKGKCSINMNKASNIIVDHCSIEWGRWDCMGPTESSMITIQNCIIGEGIDPQRFGCLCESDNITFSHNLWINNQSRNPKAKGKVQYVNNVVYNWGVTGLVGGHSAADHWLDLVNCYFIKGPNSNNSFVGQFAPTDKVYQSGNFFDGDKDGKLNGREASVRDFGEGKNAATIVDGPHVVPQVSVTTDTAEVAYEKVLAGAGASLHRDLIDARLIDAVKSLGSAGKIINDESQVGGIGELRAGEAPKDSDGDGIPDAWETAHNLNPNDPSDATASPKGSSYMFLEEYLNSLVH
jgi:pectate lyase